MKKRKSKLMKKLTASFLSLFMMFTIAFSFAVTADATTTITESGATEINRILGTKIDGYTYKNGKKDVSVTLKTLFYYDENGVRTNYALFKVSGNTYTFNSLAFEKTESELQQKALSVFVREANKSTVLGNVDKTKIYDEIKNNCSGATAAMIGVIFEDNKADLFSALKIFSPFNGVVGAILGIGTLIIIILLLASTVFDLVYLGVPVARTYLTDKQDQKGGGKPWGITHEAWTVINEVEGGGGSGSNGKYRNVYIMYFKRRIITYIVLAICILYLLSGQIAGLISWLMSLVSGFSL